MNEHLKKTARRPMSNGTLWLVLVVALCALSPAFAFDASNVWYWENYGGDKRNPLGVRSWSQYRDWFISAAGQNDLRRVNLLPEVAEKMLEMVNQRRWDGRVYTWPDGWSARLSKAVVKKGDRYDALTFNPAGVTEVNVEVAWKGQSSETVYRVEVWQPDGIGWSLDTFPKCVNGGVFSILTIKPPPPPVIPPRTPIPPETPPPTYRYRPVSVPGIALNYGEHRSAEVKGNLGAFLGVLGKWLGKPVTNLSFATGAVTGANAYAQGGQVGAVSAVTGPIDVRNAQFQGQGQGQLTIVPIVNNVGDGNAGSAAGAGTVTAPVIQAPGGAGPIEIND
ncbi:hypothetical protein HY375_01710 [Candidatus Berkelbacteria bacterium]|nr:hypothetical protein [Candidatus Berkelbacteria bacterium]